MIANTNIRSLLRKFSELEYWFNVHKPALFGITETWLSDNTSTSELHIPGYHCFRCDRFTSSYGGVLFYVTESWHPSLLETIAFEDGLCEQLWITVRPPSALPIVFGIIYRSPQGSSTDWIEPIKAFRHHARLCIMGDFNCPNINWSSHTPSESASINDHALLEAITTMGLF